MPRAAATSCSERRGELLVGHYDATNNRETLFDPPILLLPADLDVDREWTSEGTLGGADAYAVRGQVLEAGRSGAFDDCLRVRLQIAFTVDGMTGDTLFVGASSPGRGGVVVALDMADGRPRWQSELGLGSLHFAERLWSDGETVVPISSGVVLGLDAVSRFTGEIGLGG